MKKLAAAMAAIAILAASSVAMAGVVMVQKEEVTGAGPVRSVERTLLIQGNKEKMVSGNHEVITDLDKGVMYIIYPGHKMYMEMPFPPTGPMAKAMRKPTFHGAEFKKTGKSRTVAGFKCEEYTGAGKFESGEYTIKECVSANAPGASEFLAFESNMVKKLKGTAYDMSAQHPLPHGIPLAQHAKTTLTKISIPNLPPKEAAKLKEELKKRPAIVSTVEVEKIAVKKLPASTFEVPAGFQKLSASGMPHGAPAPGPKK